MAVFQARLFGELAVARGGVSLDALSRRASGSLLALLIVNRGHPVNRSRVASEMWPRRSAAGARKALRTTLWRLGKVLQEDGTETPEPLDADAEEIRLADPDAWSVDLWTFEDVLDPLLRRDGRIDGPQHARTVKAALDLHRRPFLEGLPDPWCEDRRHRSRLMWLGGLEALVRYRRCCQQWESVLMEGDLVLRVSPLRETMHREIMLAHYARGDRPSALAHYERCRHLLRTELGVSPMEPTRELHRGMLNGRPPGELARLLES